MASESGQAFDVWSPERLSCIRPNRCRALNREAAEYTWQQCWLRHEADEEELVSILCQPQPIPNLKWQCVSVSHQRGPSPSQPALMNLHKLSRISHQSPPPPSVISPQSLSSHRHKRSCCNKTFRQTVCFLWGKEFYSESNWKIDSVTVIRSAWFEENVIFIGAEGLDPNNLIPITGNYNTNADLELIPTKRRCRIIKTPAKSQTILEFRQRINCVGYSPGLSIQAEGSLTVFSLPVWKRSKTNILHPLTPWCLLAKGPASKDPTESTTTPVQMNVTHFFLLPHWILSRRCLIIVISLAVASLCIVKES